MSVPNEKDIDFIEMARVDLGKARIEECIDKINEGLKGVNNPKLIRNWRNQTISISARYYDLKEQKDQDVIIKTDYNKQFNKIIHALLTLIDFIEEELIQSNAYKSETPQNIGSFKTATGLKSIILKVDRDFFNTSNEEKETLITNILLLLNLGPDELIIKQQKPGSIIYKLEMKTQTIHKIKSLIELDLLPKEYNSCIAANEKIEAYYNALVELGIYDLSEINLNKANFWFTNLTGANLTGTNLTKTKLFRVNLRYANLIGANLCKAKLFIPDLTGADLTGANLTRMSLFRADLTGADLTGADLTGANLFRVNLTGVDLAGANLTRMSLFRADLTGADLTEADLRYVDLGGADLTGADFTNAKFLQSEETKMIDYGIDPSIVFFVKDIGVFNKVYK